MDGLSGRLGAPQGEPQRVVRSTRLPGRQRPSWAISSAIWRWRSSVLAGVEGMPCCYRILLAYRRGSAAGCLESFTFKAAGPGQAGRMGGGTVLVQRVLDR